MASKVLIVGSSNTDMVVKTKSLPTPGETVLGGDFIVAPGGKGANQAVAAARLGAEVTFVAKIGSDVFGDQAIENFRRDGIVTDYVSRDTEKPSGVALIMVDEDGENIIAVASGANSRLEPTDVAKASQVIKECAVILMQLEIPLNTVQYTASLGKRYQTQVILNPAYLF